MYKSLPDCLKRLERQTGKMETVSRSLLQEVEQTARPCYPWGLATPAPGSNIVPLSAVSLRAAPFPVKMTRPDQTGFWLCHCANISESCTNGKEDNLMPVTTASVGCLMPGMRSCLVCVLRSLQSKDGLGVVGQFKTPLPADQ